MKNYSIWKDDNETSEYQKLDKDLKVDVLIIGGGITGVSTAYHLVDSGLKVCLLEKNFIGMGVSSKTTGKLTYLQDLMYSKIKDKYSFSVAKMYYESQKEAINLVESIINKNNINCNFTYQTSYLFANKKMDINKLKEEKELLINMGVNVKDGNKLPINLFNYYNISVNDTAYFHPVKYVKSLAKICYDNGTLIYENTNIIDIKNFNDEYICFTNNNKIYAKKVVIACHYPFFLLPFFFPLKGHLERSYISASLTKNNKNVSGISASSNTKSFRYHKNDKNNYFIYLNGSHNLAFKNNVLNNFKELLDNLKMLKIKPKYIWSNEDIITNDYLPYIGKIKNNLYIGTGYNTWGMTNGSIAGLVLSDLIKEKFNKYTSLFNPKRLMPLSSFPNVVYDLFSSAKPFIGNKLIKNKKFYSNKVIFTKKDGKNVGIYIDDNNISHVVYNKCPHMKCSLIFNESELTWDCPCHSSRFDLDGNCIKGPSKFNISYKEKE